MQGCSGTMPTAPQTSYMLARFHMSIAHASPAVSSHVCSLVKARQSWIAHQPKPLLFHDMPWPGNHQGAVNGTASWGVSAMWSLEPIAGRTTSAYRNLRSSTKGKSGVCQVTPSVAR